MPSTDDAPTFDPPADGSPADDPRADDPRADDPRADDPRADDPRADDRPPYELVGVVVLAVLVLLYGFFLGRAVLPAIGVAIPLVALYLFWRLVRAHERLADALE